MEAEEPADLPSCTSLPSDAFFNILSNLSVRTLLKCRCVCKDWNSIINSRSFINMHLLHQPHGLFFSHYFDPSDPFSSTYEKTQLCSFFPDQSFSLVHKFKVPLPYSPALGPGRILVGSLDGLLCLTNWKPYGREVYLWNPSIREYKTFSGSCLFNGKYSQRFFHRKTKFILGLGFRAHTSDYIIVRIAFFKWRSRRLKKKPLTEAEIYSLSTDSWKKVGFSEDILLRVMNIWSWNYAIVNGDLNWMAMFSDGEGQPYESILSFAVNKTEFRETRLPSDYKNGIHPNDLKIGVYNDLLAVFIRGVSIPDDGNVYVWIWVMEEYGKTDSWTKTTIKTRGFRSLTGCALDGRIVFQEGHGHGRRGLVLDTETLEEQQLCVSGFESVHTFKETLVPLQGANVVSE